MLTLLCAVFSTAWGAVTGTIKFGTPNVKIDAASVTGDDSQGNTWTITTVGTTSFTQQPTYSQVGKSSSPAESITFTTTLSDDVNITAFSANFGGFSGTAGTVTLSVDDVSVGTGSLSGTTDVTTRSTSSAIGKVLTVTVTDISKGVKCYNISYTYEEVPSGPAIIASTTSVSVAAAGGDGTINMTYTDIVGNKEIQFYAADGNTETTYDWIDAEINTDGNLYYVVEENTGAERTAYLKVNGHDSNNNNISSDLITITQAEPTIDYATLPFAFDGGVKENASYPSVAGTTGLTQNGLGSDYDSSPHMKFNDTGDYLILKINERPGKLTFDIKGNTFSSGSTSTFKVQTSADGTTYTDLETYNELSSTTPQSEEFTTLGENVRYIKWIYTEKGATNGGNVALGNITLGKYGEENSYILTITPNAHAEIFAFNEEDQTEQISTGSSVQAGTVILLSVDVASGYQLQSVSVVDGDLLTVDLTEGDEGTYTFTMPESPVTVSCTVLEPGSGKIYQKVTTLRNGTYLIVYEAGELAFDGSRSNTTLDAAGNSIPVEINNGQISGTATIDAATFTYDKKTGTLKSASGLYIGKTNNDTGMDASTSTWYTNTITFDENGNATITSSGGAALRYNSTSNPGRFRYYKSNSTVKTPVQLYRLVDPESIDAVTISSVGYASLYYSSVNLTVPANVTAYTYKLNADNNPTISKTYGPGSVIPEGEGVILKGSAGTYQFAVSSTVPASDPDNKLKGSDTREMTTGPGGETTGYLFYVLSTYNGANPGFYFNHDEGNEEGSAFECAPHKVYLPIPKPTQGTDGQVSSFTFDDLNGINETVVSKEMNEGAYTISGVKVDGNKLQKGLYIINGKKVVIK